MAIPAWMRGRRTGTGFRLEAAVVESQAMDGRSGVDDLPIIKLDESCNGAAFIDERKKLREK